MRPNRRYVNDMIIEELSQRWDDTLSECNFLRRPRSLKYVRQFGDAFQELEFVFQMSPNFAPGALAHILPRVRIRLGSVNELAAKIAGDDPGYAPMNKEWTYGTNATNLGTIRHQREMVMYDRESLVALLEVLLTQFELYFRPFLDQCMSPLGLTDLFESKAIPMSGAPGVIRMGAAYLLQGRTGEANDLWKKRLDLPGLQILYPRSIAYSRSLGLSTRRGDDLDVLLTDTGASGAQ
jgi:hypothetical protein